MTDDRHSIPENCPDCGAEVQETPAAEEGTIVTHQCSECGGYYAIEDGWVSEEEIQDIIQHLREQAQAAHNPGAVTADALPDDPPQAAHEIREDLSAKAASSIPEHTDLDPGEQGELLRRLTVSIHKTTASYLRSLEE